MSERRMAGPRRPPRPFGEPSAAPVTTGRGVAVKESAREPTGFG